MIVKETRIVVIIDKDTEGIDILEVLGLLVISVTDVVHGFRATEDITDCVVHWVVEKCSQVVLIRSHVCRVSIEAFTHLEHTCRFTVLRPKISWDFWNSVNPDTIEAILLNDAFDPVLEVATDVVIVLVKIWQVSQSAVFDRILIIPVDITWVVVVRALVEWVDLTVVSADWGNMVSNDIDHNPDTLFVGCRDESFEIVFGTEVLIDVFPVCSPVSMIARLFIFHDWRDPDGIETHARDVIKVLDHTLVVSTTIVAQISTRIGATVTSGKSIRENLVHGSFFPGSGVTSDCSSSESGSN
jgi:hypothetical protein